MTKPYGKHADRALGLALHHQKVQGRHARKVKPMDVRHVGITQILELVEPTYMNRAQRRRRG